MATTVEAVYENGVLKPLQPLPLQEHDRVRITVHEKQSVARESAGMLRWHGDWETLRRIAEDDEFGIMESPGSEVAEAPPQTWDSLIDELLRIHDLEDDWDGEGSEAPHPVLVDGAITLARSLEARGLPPADRVIASVNGTVYFEWHTPLGYQEIELTSPLDAECRWVPKSADATVVGGLSRRR